MKMQTQVSGKTQTPQKLTLNYVRQNPGVYRITKDTGFIVSFKTGSENDINYIYIDENGIATGVPTRDNSWHLYTFYLATEKVMASFEND